MVIRFSVAELALKQNIVSSTAQIAENCVTNLVTDLGARPTLSQLNNGNLDIAINQLTVNHIIATNQTVQYSEMDISNNEITLVKSVPSKITFLPPK